MYNRDLWIRMVVGVLMLGALIRVSVADPIPAQHPQMTSTTQTVRVTQKVVIQVSDDDVKKWELALNNAKAFQEVLGKGKVQVEIVAVGPGINMVKIDSPVGARLEITANTGVRLVACQRTMTAQHLTRADIHPSVGIVESGSVELILRQQEGWVSFRP